MWNWDTTINGRNFMKKILDKLFGLSFFFNFLLRKHSKFACLFKILIRLYSKNMEADIKKENLSQPRVEVFRTNVSDYHFANSIIRKLENLIPSAEINFDLEDCDNILRIKSKTGDIDIPTIVHQAKCLGFEIEILY